jgi:DNA (cytosine-5)-methyltransferase 1
VAAPVVTEPVVTLPTPCARDGKGPGMQRGLPDLVERRPPGIALDNRSGQLLPTPTARAYGSNQSLSAGAAVRPSLATLAARRLLPTPRTSDARGPAHHGDGGSDLRTAVWLLPTPKATDGTKGCPAQRGSKGDLTLPSAAVRLDLADVRGKGGTAGADEDGADGNGADAGGEGRLLPTPRLPERRAASTAATTDDARAGSRPEGQAAGIADGVLPRELDSWAQAPAAWQPPDAATAGRGWGPYAGAVARWECLTGRPAPAPTQPGIHGKPVLAPPFVEWLMGLDEGFVTGLGLPRTLALRVLGNGVVPQQAAAALRLLLCPCRWAVNP